MLFCLIFLFKKTVSVLINPYITCVQGSKSDIKVDLSNANDSSETNEPIFKMDEDISGAVEALNNLDVSSNLQNRSYHRDFFSDTEVEATNTPPNSRPGTPIQSDSEYEISKTQKVAFYTFTK